MKRRELSRFQRYGRTRKGCLVRAYTYALVRLRRDPAYAGLAICDRREFYDAALADPRFHVLYDGWVQRRYSKHARPTPDRIDTTIGYVPSNIRWRTYLDNVTSSSGFVGQQQRAHSATGDP